jgi:8-oxo-dGTP diphosphatase
VTAEVERFATPRVAAGVLFRHPDGRVLLVKPTYKDGWEIPGGYVETGESPRAAAVREVHEVLGLDGDLGPMLALDWAPHPAEGDKLLLIFDGGQLDDPTVSGLALAQHEISDAAFFPVDRLFDLMPARLASRVSYAATRHANAYLEHGVEPEHRIVASAN